MCGHPAHRGSAKTAGAREDIQEDNSHGFCARGRGVTYFFGTHNKNPQVGGLDGMKIFVLTPEFKAMNVGFCLDEGIAGPEEVIPLFYGERNIFWIKV